MADFHPCARRGVQTIPKSGARGALRVARLYGGRQTDDVAFAENSNTPATDRELAAFA